MITLPQHNGKMDAAELRELVATFYADGNHDHMVFPGMVYISHPTEYGTLYTKAELEALHTVCQEYKMPLFLDGARLGYGLAAEGTDVTLADLARLTDVFYIGGTKVGALCGEAVVFPHGAPAHFMTMVKQQGALLAKGRLLGIQFDVLFTDGLYLSISKNAIDTAERLKKGFAEKGYRFFMDSPTNQIFLVLENAQLAALEGKAKFGFWEKFDDSHTVEDYEFRFDQPESPVILDASGGGLLTGKCCYQWKNQQAIQLTNDLFDNDSFCMAGLRTRTLGIYEKDTGRSIVCDVAGFPYTLIWSALSKPVRFVCIEPWNSLPASVDDPQEWEQRAAAACLAPGGEWSTTLSTTFNR